MYPAIGGFIWETVKLLALPLALLTLIGLLAFRRNRFFRNDYLWRRNPLLYAVIFLTVGGVLMLVDVLLVPQLGFLFVLVGLGYWFCQLVYVGRVRSLPRDAYR